MKKICIVLIFIFALCLSGCDSTPKNQKESVLPIIDEDYFEIVDGSAYFRYNEYTEYEPLMLLFVSAKPIDKNDITIEFESNYTFDYVVGVDEVEEMPYTVFCSYNGLDWKEYAQLDFSENNEDHEKAIKINDNLFNLYSK